MHILIDGDPIVYRNGVAGEDRTYEVIVEDTTTGELDSLMFEDGNKIRPFFKDHPHLVKVDQECIRIARPVGHALGPIKRTLVGIQNEVKDRFGLRSKDISFQVYLTGPGNFRESLAKERVYKGNRDRSMRPLWYEECRVYLQERWDARVITGYEADDAISIEARALWESKTPHVVATVDKDLDQIPGPHYDYGKKVWYHMDEESAMMFFYVQCLQGDTTDNIPGVYRLGQVNAERLVKEWAAEYYTYVAKDKGTLEEWLWAHVVDTYRTSLKKFPAQYKGDDAEAIAIENARLVKMQEYAGQLWTPPGQPDGVIEGWGRL